MIGIYYAFLAIISAIIYMLSVTFKNKNKKAGSVACYVILFLIALLFI